LFRVQLEADARLDDAALGRLVEVLGADEHIRLASLGYEATGEPLRVWLVVPGPPAQAHDVAAAALTGALGVVGADARPTVVAVEPEPSAAAGPPFFVLVSAGRHDARGAADRLLGALLADPRVGEASVSGGAELTAFVVLDEPRSHVEAEAVDAVARALDRAGLDSTLVRVASVSGPDGSPA
jgi:hypothetical protein